MNFTAIHLFSVDLCSNNGNGECSTGVAGKLHLSLVIICTIFLCRICSDWWNVFSVKELYY